MDTRISKLITYLEKILEKLDNNYKSINVDWLDLKINNYSLDKIPTASTIEEDIVGNRRCRDVYSFRSKKAYSSSQVNNLKNIGFFEKFESIIKSNNDEGVLPEIDGIESVACLNCGTFNSADASQKTAIFDIQLQIIYEEE